MVARRKLLGGWTLAVPAILAFSAGVAFAPPDVFPTAGTVGTQITLNGSGFGAAGGKATLVDASSGATTTLKVVTWSDAQVVATIPKMPKSGFMDYRVSFTPKGGSYIRMTQPFTFSQMELTAVTPETGAAGATVTIDGNYFGLKPGKVALRWPNPKKPSFLAKSCKVTSWTMDPTTGVSQAIVVVPKMAPGSYTLDVDNGTSNWGWSNDFVVTP